jgi:uncharacterized protein YecT (DUF1311 family)
MSRVLIRIAAAVFASVAVPTFAASSEHYSFKLELTPEEGPRDLAIEGRKSLEWGTCVQGAQTTQQSAACQSDEFLRRDSELNRVWRVTFGRVAPVKRPALLAAQRRWLAARDPFCRKESERYSGGTIAPIIYASCRVELTIRRTIWLEAIQR